MDVGLEAAII